MWNHLTDSIIHNLQYSHGLVYLDPAVNGITASEVGYLSPAEACLQVANLSSAEAQDYHCLQIKNSNS